MKHKLQALFDVPIEVNQNLIILNEHSDFPEQEQTNETFTEKWLKHDTKHTLEGIEKFQLEWYLSLYGFKNESNLKKYLQTKYFILDAGCGLGYKAAWFATLSPESIVIGMEFSEAAIEAANYYKKIKNLFFVRGDIANTHIKLGSLNFISCDQVIHHTQFPEKTFRHLSERLDISGEFSCYVYAKKALPRELLDEYFRSFSPKCTRKELWKLSEELTQLGKILSDLKLEIDFPDIPLLGIKGGKQNIQRFIYWNFLKCFWNEQFGWINSVSTNFDWYAPANANRYSVIEFKQWVADNGLGIKYFHTEEACHSGRFFRI